MKFLIPSAKEMQLAAPALPFELNDKTQPLIQHLSNYSPEDLASFYKIKPAAALEEYDRIKALANQTAPCYQAIELFNGLMYRYIDRPALTSIIRQEQVFIATALYGIIPASQLIAAHRLDFQNPLKVAGKRLKNYWQADYDDFLKTDDLFVSLLSSEFETVFSKAYRDKLVQINFMEEKAGQVKTHSTISKKGRGAFLSTAIKAKAQSLTDLSRLQFDDFSYRSDLSEAKKLVFVKKQ